MSDLTEQEIFDCLATNFRLAAENCSKLANLPRKGRSYRELVDQLALIEGASRQACHWRGDTRWLEIADRSHYAHKFAGDWLKKYRAERSMGFLKQLFMKLGEFMEFGLKLSLELKDNKTGILGPILPDYMQKSSIRNNSHPVMRISSGGIIIPDGVM